MSNALQAAKVYVARKWNPLPLPFKAKKPTDNDWQKRVIGEADLPQYFNGKKQNVGVVLGPTSNGLTDTDLDCREAVELAPHTLPKTNAIFGRASAPASHWLYRTTLASTSEDENAVFQFKDPTNNAMLLEVRVGGVKGAQTVFPGSVHESGEEIRWDETGDEAEVDGNDLLKRARLLASICLLARYWPGSKARHDAALSVGGFLARAAVPTSTIKYLVEAIARTAGDGDPKNRRDTAEDAAKAFHAGKHARGYPEVKKAFGEEVAKQIAEWLDYEGSIGDDNGGVVDVGGPIEPVDLWGSFEPPTLPRGLLPKLIEDYAFTQGETMGVDPGGVAMAAMAVCAAATPDDIKLKMKRHSDEWIEPARLWVGLVGLPSAKKTPIISAVARPLVRLDAILLKEFLDELQRWEQLDKEQKKAVPKPLQKRHRLEDTTIEAAQEALAGSPDGLLLMQDELSGFFGSIDKYSGHRGAGKDRGFWLQSYNGGPYALNRITRGVGIIPNLSVSLLGGIQPDVIRRLASESLDDGLLQRMMLVVMRPGGVGKDVTMPNVAKDYTQLIERLTKVQTEWGMLHFDNSAQDLRQRLEMRHVELMNVEAINKKLAAHIGKYDGMFGRLCVAFHCIEHAHDPDIPDIVTGEVAERVAKFMQRFLLPHALGFYSGVLGVADDHDRLANVAGYILTHEGEILTNRDIQRGCRTMRKLERRDTEAVFEQLSALGWVTMTPGPRRTDPPHWKVNPRVREKFAERAKQEAERRQHERAVILDIVRQRDGDVQTQKEDD